MCCFCRQKVIAELLIADATRRGFVDGRCLRLPTIIVRPGRCVIRSSLPEHLILQLSPWLKVQSLIYTLIKGKVFIVGIASNYHKVLYACSLYLWWTWCDQQYDVLHLIIFGKCVKNLLSKSCWSTVFLLNCTCRFNLLVSQWSQTSISLSISFYISVASWRIYIDRKNNPVDKYFGRPNTAASSFCSSIIREPLKGETAVCPVSPDLPLFVQVHVLLLLLLLYFQFDN